MKPLVEGLVLKFLSGPKSPLFFEAPRGGAGIEILQQRRLEQRRLKPLVEGLVLK